MTLLALIRTVQRLRLDILIEKQQLASEDLKSLEKKSNTKLYLFILLISHCHLYGQYGDNRKFYKTVLVFHPAIIIDRKTLLLCFNYFFLCHWITCRYAAVKQQQKGASVLRGARSESRTLYDFTVIIYVTDERLW